MDEMKKEIVFTALKGMLKDKYFSICTIDKCLKLTNAQPSSDDYAQLAAMHCINWGDMSPKLREYVAELTLKVITSPSIDLETLELKFNNAINAFELTQPKEKGFFKKLIERT